MLKEFTVCIESMHTVNSLISWHYSCMLSRNGIAPYRELTFLVHRANVKRVHGMHRVYAYRELSYFLIVFIYIYINTCYEHISRGSGELYIVCLSYTVYALRVP